MMHGLQLFPMGVAPYIFSSLECFWKITVLQYKHKFHFKSDPKSKSYIRTLSKRSWPPVGLGNVKESVLSFGWLVSVFF